MRLSVNMLHGSAKVASWLLAWAIRSGEKALLFARFDTCQIGSRLPAGGRRASRTYPGSPAPIYIRLFAALNPLFNGPWPYEQRTKKLCPAEFPDWSEASCNHCIGQSHCATLTYRATCPQAA